MDFICDNNLGKLAKYLRVLGFDTRYDNSIDTPGLLRAAASQNRFLLTRDRKLLSKSHPYGILIIEQDNPDEQLKQVLKKLSLKINLSLLFSRCSLCNSPMQDIDKTAAANKIFPFILKTQKQIKICPSCGRYYWRGSHYKRILKKLETIIDDKMLIGKWPNYND